MIFSLCAVLFGCKSGDEQSAPPQSQKEYRLGFAALPSKTGTKVQFKAVFAAVITDTDEKIVKCIVDEADASPDMNDFSESIGKEFPTKYALGADYGMASASPIGKEWSEQAKAFADYCVGKTVKELEESLGADGELLGQLALAQDLDAVLALGKDASLEQNIDVDLGAVFKALKSSHVHGLKTLGENVVETALGDAAGQRHLAAFKADANAAAGAGVLTLVTTACGLAVAGGVAAALTLGHVGAAGSGRKIVKFHEFPLLILR